MKNKLMEIYENYGKSHQISKLLEEIGELIETIINDDIINMESELADCMVLLKQFQIYYGINSDKVKSIMEFKIERQLERIKNEN